MQYHTNLAGPKVLIKLPKLVRCVRSALQPSAAAVVAGGRGGGGEYLKLISVATY